MGIDHPAGIIKTIVPIVMAGVLGIYGLIVSVIITQAVAPPSQADGTNTYSTYNAYTHVRIRTIWNERWTLESQRARTCRMMMIASSCWLLLTFFAALLLLVPWL